MKSQQSTRMTPVFFVAMVAMLWATSGVAQGQAKAKEAGVKDRPAEIAQGNASSRTGDPIPDLDVSLDRKPSGIVQRSKTNTKGTFSFSAVAPGSYSLVITIPGPPLRTPPSGATKSFFESRSNIARIANTKWIGAPTWEYQFSLEGDALTPGDGTMSEITLPTSDRGARLQAQQATMIELAFVVTGSSPANVSGVVQRLSNTGRTKPVPLNPTSDKLKPAQP